MNKIPLLLHIIFHPNSKASRNTALEIHKVLNQDSEVPGLRIPTRFTPEPRDGDLLLPPTNSDFFNEADRVFIVVLVDDYLNEEYEDEIPAGRQDWHDWVADLYEKCGDHAMRRCVPFQMTKHAWPLNERLREVNFPRVFAEKDEDQFPWLMERLTIELIRFLEGETSANAENSQAPIQAFLSHTKWDLNNGMGIIPKLQSYLNIAQPIRGWFDSGDIEAGSVFSKKIEEGVKDSALITVLTDMYATREWCRKEIVLAKENQRPLVVINALKKIEIRGFPYLGNVPSIHWEMDSDGEPIPGMERAVLLFLLKETLRQLHMRIILNGQKQPTDEVLVSPPELFTVSGKSDTTFLYPDPPLGQVERNILVEKAGVKVVTPLQRFAEARPLRRRKIAVSLSESGDQLNYGFDLLHLDQQAIEISRYLLLAGASIYYGGHLGDEGYTVSLFELVHSHPVEELPPIERIHNYVGWPLPLSTVDKSPHRHSARFRRIGRPDGLSEVDHEDFVEHVNEFFPAGKSALHRYAWARGMTKMREAQTADVEARVVLGGKAGPTITAQAEGGRTVSWYASRIPGVLEEILCSMKVNQPVYLVGGFGGCARIVADLIQGKSRQEVTWEFQKDAPNAPEMRELYHTKGMEWWGYTDMEKFIKECGYDGLNNGLTKEENDELFVTGNTSAIVSLIMKGMGNIFQ